MIILPDPVANTKARHAIRRANGGEGYTVRLQLLVGGEDLSELLEEAEWGQTELPITIDAKLSGYLPRRLQDARVHLLAEIDGEPVRQMIGEKTVLMPSDSAYSTDLVSSSAGSLATGEDAIKLGAFTEYLAAAPHSVVHDAAKRLPYDFNRVRIEPVPGVVLNLAGSGETPGFLASEAVGDVLARLADSEAGVGYDYRDTATGGFIAFIPKPVGEIQPVPDEHFRSYHARQLPNWAAQRPTPPLLRYSDVRVYRNDESGSLLWEKVVEVPYPPGVRAPHKKRTLDIASEDSSEFGSDNGRKIALVKAYELASAAHVGDELTLPAYDPLIERSDPFRVSEQYRDDDGTWEVAWAMQVQTYKHVFGGSGLQVASLDTAVAYTAQIIAEERIQAPALIVPRPTLGVLRAPRDPYGVSEGGTGDDLYFDEPLPWITKQGDDLIFDDTAPESVTVEAGDVVVVK